MAAMTYDAEREVAKFFKLKQYSLQKIFMIKFQKNNIPIPSAVSISLHQCTRFFFHSSVCLYGRQTLGNF